MPKQLPATCRWAVLCLLIGCISRTVQAAPPPGGQLIDRVLQAYRETDHYDATLKLSIEQTHGRWTQSQTGEIYLAFDRPNNRLSIDAPDYLLLTHDGKLYFRTVRIPGKHLEIDLPNPLTCEWIVQQAPDMVYPAIPTDLAFLLSADPLAFVSRGAAGAPATVPPDPDDPLKRPRVEVALQAGTLTLTINPQTFLIDKAVVQADAAQLNLAFGTKVSYTFQIEVHNIGQPVADDRFAFDTTNSKPSQSMQHMMASASNAPHPLVDQPTPPLNLPDIHGNDHDIAIDDANAKVIVLDFWATWCPPCVVGLGNLQEIYDWVQAQGKPVAIYAVNQGETVDDIKQFMAENNLSIPVLMDENFTAAQSFQVNGVPATVIIADGKVKYFHAVFDPDSDKQIKAEIEQLLAE